MLRLSAGIWQWFRRVLSKKRLKLCRLGISFHLSGVLATGNHARNSRIFQAPRQSPLSHRNSGRHLALAEAFYLGEIVLHFLRIESRSHIGRFERSTRPEFAGALLLGEHCPQFLIVKKPIRARMKLVNIYRFDAQTLERLFKLVTDTIDRKIVGAI